MDSYNSATIEQQIKLLEETKKFIFLHATEVTIQHPS